MKATIDVPDDIYRRVKAKTALQGRAIRDVTIELYQRWLVESEDGPSSVPVGKESESPLVSAYEMMKEYCGIFHSGVEDLGSNPKHLEDFGREKPAGRFADGCGIVSSGVGDLSSNPKHLEGLGRA